MDPSQRVRQLWTDFESWAAQQRARLEQECAGIEEKWRHKSSWSNNKQPSSSNDLQRQKEIRDARERYTTSVRTEWDRRLNAHKLRDSDWGFIAEQEQERIEIVMGGDLEDPSPSSLPVAKVPTPPQAQPQRTQQPPPVVTQAPPAPSRPVPAPIQPVAPQLNQPPSAGPSSSLSFSAAIRSANTSTSSSSAYTFVDPSDFTTDDELFEPNSSYVIPTDESEDDSISIANPELWGIAPTHGRSSNRSSQSSSPDYPNTHAFDHPSAFSKPDLHTSSPKRLPPDPDKPAAAAGKPRVRGPSYIGPKLHDEDDKSEEELDFEKFKMHARITKIWEFHFAAAQADVELAMNIYNERQTKKVTGVKSDDASKIAQHEKRMFRLQAEKEIERKALVSEERKKRREAIQKRGALREPSKNANIVDPTSANRPWENFYDAESTHIAFDASGRLVHSRDLPEDDCDEPEDDEEEIDEEDEVDDEEFNPAIASRGQFGTLKPSAASKLVPPEPADRATPSGWKKKSTLAATTSSWDSSPASAPAPTPAIPKANNPFANSLPSPLAQTQDSPWGNGFAEEPHIPGHFSDDSPTTPTLGSLGSWASWGGGGKKPAVPSKLAQVVGSTPSPPRSQIERENEDPSFDVPPASISTPVAQLNGKKTTLTGAAKKRLSVSQQKASSAPAVPTLAKAEAETKTPTMTARIPDGVANPKDLLHQKWALHAHAEEELSSTPRPSLMTGAMKRGLSNGVNPHAQAHDFNPESVLTPRVGMRRLDNSMHAGGAMTDNETPWQRHERLQKSGPIPAPKPTASSGAQVFDDDDDDTENSIWSRGGMKQQQQPPQQPQPKQVQSMARAGAAKQVPSMVQQQQSQDEESIWSQVMKSKAQAQTSVPQPIATVNIAEMEDQARMWEGFKSQKAGMGATSNLGKPVNGARNVPRQPLVSKESELEPEETPWQRMQRMQRLSAMAANVASTAPPPAPPVAGKHSWGPTNDFEGPSRHKPQMSNAFENDQYWSPQAATAGRAPQSAWGPPNPSRGPMKRITNGGTVMIEDVEDEQEAEAWNGRGSTLPPDSKVLLDIAVPKPSKPSMMYDNIIGYGEDGEEDEEGYNTGLSSSIPTPSTAPTSPPNEVPTMEDDWFTSVSEGMKNGDWDNIIERARQDDFSSPNAIPIPAAKQKPKTAWGIPSLSKASPPTSQFDSAKLRSALEQVSSTPTASGPSPPKAPGAKASPPVPPPKIAVKAPMAPEPKETPAAKTAPPPPAAAKGKAKKGKGRK